eukprot:4620902-Amphidinium_carterae.1
MIPCVYLLLPRLPSGLLLPGLKLLLSSFWMLCLFALVLRVASSILCSPPGLDVIPRGAPSLPRAQKRGFAFAKALVATQSVAMTARHSSTGRAEKRADL